MNTLNRRDFLKFAGLVLATGTVLPVQRSIAQGAQLPANPQIRFGRNLIRGTSYGVILSSSDEGSTWKELASFGECHAVLQFAEKNKQIYANLGLGSRDFWLRSVDAQRWFTV